MMQKAPFIPIRGYQRRKVSGILSPGSKEWVAREAPVKPSKWKSRKEFAKAAAGSRPDLLDKLAESSQPGLGADYSNPGQKESLRKRAKRKYFSYNLAFNLAQLDSPLKKSYLNSLYCCSELKQDGDKITGKYCKNRWCMVCNSIRTGKSLNGYEPQFKKLIDPQFLTLTIPNVKKDELRTTIRGMKKQWTAIYKKLHRQCQKLKIKLVGIQKLECTYNPIEDSYHPHFHFIIEGKPIAEAIHDEWLHRYPEARSIAQKIKPADLESMKELFKYFTKVVTSSGKERRIYYAPMDVIFRAMVGYKVFQPFGIRPVNDEPDELEAITVEEYVDQLTWWKWINNDWYHSISGEPLTGFNRIEVYESLFKNAVY